MATLTPMALPARRHALWAAALLAYVLAWTVLPVVLAPSLPLDGVESIAWGHEWQWGYYKHPPLPAWLLYGSFALLGRFGPYLLSQLAILLALFYVYRLARELLGPERAGLAAALLYGVYYYTWPTLEFNHNIAQIPVWAALAWHAHRAMQRDGWRDWIWLGAWAGIGLLTKYSTGVFLACLGAYLLLSHHRRLLCRPGPWLALLVGVIVVAPHGLWLLRHGGLPFAYLAARSQNGPAADHAAGLEFLGAQLVAHLPLLVIVLAGGLRPWGRRLLLRDPAQRAWLFTIALAPALGVAIGGTIRGADLHDMWATPMWNFSALLLLAFVPADTLARRRHALMRALAVWMALVTLAMAGYLAFGAGARGRPARMDWPAQALSAQAQQQWQHASTCPLQVVAGSYWLAGLVAEGVRPMASVLIEGDARYSPWITPERLQRQGALLVWRDDGEGIAAPSVPALSIEPAPPWRITEGVWQIAWSRNTGGAPLRVRWRAYVPAACAPG